MSKLDKKIAKLQERIDTLESELRSSLSRKTAGEKIDVPTQTRKIQELKEQLSKL